MCIMSATGGVGRHRRSLVLDATRRLASWYSELVAVLDKQNTNVHYSARVVSDATEERQSGGLPCMAMASVETNCLCIGVLEN